MMTLLLYLEKHYYHNMCVGKTHTHVIVYEKYYMNVLIPMDSIVHLPTSMIRIR